MMALSNPVELGKSIRSNRRAVGYTLSELAAKVGCRRQTLADLESGRNVGIHTAMTALAVLNKGLLVADRRPELDRLEDIFSDPED
jgi:transcriptional regulator with XRE-family HTH domain